jgi:uncharacterized protein
MDVLKDTLAEQKGSGVTFLPVEATYASVKSADGFAARWLQGLLFAHQQLEPIWQSAWQGMQQKQPDKAPKRGKDLQHCLSLFTTFADLPFALQNQADDTFEKKLPDIFATLPRALTRYLSLSEALVPYLPDQFEQIIQR